MVSLKNILGYCRIYNMCDSIIALWFLYKRRIKNIIIRKHIIFQIIRHNFITSFDQQINRNLLLVPKQNVFIVGDFHTSITVISFLEWFFVFGAHYASLNYFLFCLGSLSLCPIHLFQYFISFYKCKTWFIYFLSFYFFSYERIYKSWNFRSLDYYFFIKI